DRDQALAAVWGDARCGGAPDRDPDERTRWREREHRAVRGGARGRGRGSRRGAAPRERFRRPGSLVGERALDVEAYMAERIPRIDAAIEARFERSAGRVPEALHGAMRHLLFPGGKRLRPIFALAAAEAVGGQAGAAL